MAANTTTNSNANVTLIERTDVHKSCKALENIVNAFNDYCQLAESLALVQKKMAKALKDAVGLKATNELAGNALSAAASLLEALAEVDTKFVKVADKECDAASNDLKKWFKKLAKDEKAHDDRIASANAKIKQAGQLYEKKAKKKDRDAAEEHTRYVNLLSVVGPEMSQEKYNHSLFVTQKHTLAVYSVVSSILRTADAEWTRACECVRRFSPMVGNLGECRAYLEGGWMASLPEVEEEAAKPSTRAYRDSQEEGRMDSVKESGSERVELATTVDEMGMRVRSPASEEASGPRSPRLVQTPFASVSAGTPGSGTANSSASSSQIPPQSQTQTGTINRNPPPTSYFNAMAAAKLNTDSVRSIESLSSFPSPPTHFPLPGMDKAPTPLSQSVTMDESGNTGPRLTGAENLNSDSVGDDHHQGRGTANSTPYFGVSTPALTDESARSPQMNMMEPRTPPSNSIENDNDASRKETETIKVKAQDLVSSAGIHGQQANSSDGASSSPIEGPTQVRKVSGTATGTGMGLMERSSSALSSNSIVASMRDKWSRTETTPPSPTKERTAPRLSNTGKVSELANRYRPGIDTAIPTPLSPRNTGASSPTLERPRQFSDSQHQQQQLQSAGYQAQRPQASEESRNSLSSSGGVGGQGGGDMGPPTSASEFDTDIIWRRRRLEELEDLERREQAQVLRERERELERRAKEVENERARLRAFATGGGPGGGGASPSIPLPMSVSMSTRPRYSSDAASAVRPHSQHSYSMTSLVAPLGYRDGVGGYGNSNTGTGAERESLSLQRPLSHHGDPRLTSSPLEPAPSMTASYSSSSSTSNANANAPRPRADHAPYCGCYACSAAQYGSGGSGGGKGQMLPPPSPRTQTHNQGRLEKEKEKPKGWMRRLSMPAVSNAFSSSDSHKKSIYTSGGISSSGGGRGVGVGPLSGGGGGGGADPSFPRFEPDHTGGISNISRPRKLSFGRR